MTFRQATPHDLPTIYEILEGAIRRLGEAGVDQWQHGYPNRARIEADVKESIGYVIEQADEVLGGQIAVGTQVCGGDLFVIVVAHVGKRPTQRGRQLLFFIGGGILDEGRGSLRKLCENFAEGQRDKQGDQMLFAGTLV